MASSLDNEGSSHLNLLALQSRMKCDPQGYESELLLQLRHFEACLSVFQLQYSANSQSSSSNDHSAAKEVSDIAMFLAHMAPFYPKHLSHFPQKILGMLHSNGHSLPSTLRRQLTHALILLRNRQMIELVEILPALMELQTFGDKVLRKLAALHIVQDVRRMSLKHKNESKTRALQNIVLQLLQIDDESRAKRALILLCELHKRKLWTDERTSNAICAACFHKSSRILKATLCFLLGYEKFEEEEENSNAEEDVDYEPCVSLSREAIYKAHHKGTVSSRKKKQAKLQRVMRSLKKQQRTKNKAAVGSNSPLDHLQDPQGFAEKLFSRLHTCNERFEVKLMMIKVISRVIGLHRLIVLNFYPFLQKYVQPHQREVTHVLAAAVQACHDMVPPDAVESLLRQLVNQFVHDRARPEVIAVGLNVVREICARMPLVMTRELLHDLALYKKSREKAVSSAARSIIAVFRQLYPSLLEKRDRGKGADLLARPKKFGENPVPSNVPGIELLAADDFEDSEAESAEFHSDSCNSDDEQESVEEHNDGEEDEIEADAKNAASDVERGEGTAVSYSESGSSELDVSDEDLDMSDEDMECEDASGRTDEAYQNALGNHLESELKRCRVENEDLAEPDLKRRRVGDEGIEFKGNGEFSLRQLKKLAFKEDNGKEKLKQLQMSDDGILSNADFARIRKLQAKKAVQEALGENGFGRPERRVNPALLEAKIRKRREKDERLATVRAGQEEREAYRPRTAVKQTKSGGLTNRQKEKSKILPLAAKLAKASKSRNQKKAKRRLTKQFRGRKAWK